MKADAGEGLVPAAAVRGLIDDCMRKVGVPPQDAAKIAELMLEADLVGADQIGLQHQFGEFGSVVRRNADLPH